jgi:hypothetical protein
MTILYAIVALILFLLLLAALLPKNYSFCIANDPKTHERSKRICQLI